MRNIISIISILFFLVPVFGQQQTEKLKITHLTGDFFIYTTYSIYEGDRIPAHGMYLVTDKGVALFDTPWDSTQFQPLLDSIEQKHHQKVILCIATHWHSDRTAGLEYYRNQGIMTYTTKLTDDYSRKNNKKRAEYLFERDTVFRVGQYAFETYYPGEGHTADNIVIWFNKEKILYGGGLIKGADAKKLGYLGDAHVKTNSLTLQKVKQKFPGPEFIIVSHSDWNNINSLDHSIQLAKELRKGK